MHLVNLQLDHFRNFTAETVELSDGTNLLSGKNGQGKTNLLESIYILGHGKSYRTAHVRECVQHGRAECSVAGTVRHSAGERKIQVRIRPPEKVLVLFGKEVSLDEFVGQFHVVAFTHRHLGVVRGEPADRRAFLDRGMMALYPGHVTSLVNYMRALKHRNRLLADSATAEGGRASEDQLDSWDQMLAGEGSRILWNRMRYVDELKGELPHRLFAGETVRIHYVCSLRGDADSVDALRSGLMAALRRERARDVRSGHTSIGPHRDEMKIFVDGKEAAAFGSAGQQRSALLALYFAQMEIHRKRQGFYPVFLVDDVEAELDDQRLRCFLAYLGERTQTLLTTAKEKMIPELGGPVTRFTVDSGRISRAK